MKQQTLTISFLAWIVFALFSCDNSNRNKSVPPTEKSTFDSLIFSNKAFFKMDTLEKFPNELNILIKGDIINIFQVDFNGDKKPDFICNYKPTSKVDNADYLQDWITSDKIVVKTKKKYAMTFDYFWFVNLDNDIEPEFFSATGYEDGIDYAVFDQNISSGKDKLLFYLNPVIIENGEYFWGYAWDIEDVILKSDAGNIYLKSAFSNDIKRDITTPDSIFSMPIIFFNGHSTQPDIKVDGIQNVKWTKLDEIQ